MLIGLLLLFFGIRLFRTVLATCCFIGGALFAFTIITNLETHWPYGDTVTLLVCLAVGVVAAVLGLWMWMLALVVMGALGGFTMAMYMLSWRGGRLMEEHVSRPVFIAAVTVLGGLVAIVYERGIIALATCIIGSVSLCSGLDVFAETGFNEMMQAFLKNSSSFSNLDGTTYTLLGSCAVVAFLGMTVQLSITGSQPKKT